VSICQEANQYWLRPQSIKSDKVSVRSCSIVLSWLPYLYCQNISHVHIATPINTLLSYVFQCRYQLARVNMLIGCLLALVRVGVVYRTFHAW
jgi:hypothetical protein